MARNLVKARTYCDYATFRELSSEIAKLHGYNGSTYGQACVIFSPPPCVINSRSRENDELLIIFTWLCYVTYILGLKDEVDFESVLTKEVNTDAAHML